MKPLTLAACTAFAFLVGICAAHTLNTMITAAVAGQLEISQ